MTLTARHATRLLRRRHSGRVLALLGGTTGMADFTFRLAPVRIHGYGETIGTWHSLCGSWAGRLGQALSPRAAADCGYAGDVVTLLTLGLWLAAALLAAGLWLLLAPVPAAPGEADA